MNTPPTPATEPHPARKGLPPMSTTTPAADTPDVFAPYSPSPSLDPLVGRRFPAECDYCAAYATMRRPYPGVYWLTTIHALGCPGLLHDKDGDE